MLELWLPLLLCFAVAIAWYEALRVREAAVAHARQLCEQHGLQFLDDSVALHRLRPRWQRGALCWLREYRFDTSLGGNDRATASMTLLGQRVVHITLPVRQPVATLPTSPVADARQPSDSAATGSNVVPFDRSRRTLH